MPFLPGPRARAKRVMRKLPVVVTRHLAAQNKVNADELVETQKGFARDGKTGRLAASINREDAESPSGIAQRVSAGGEPTRKTVRKSRKGNSPEYDYAMANEFGTEDAPAHPFFWPAWRLKRKRFKTRMSRAGKKGIAEASKA